MIRRRPPDFMRGIREADAAESVEIVIEEGPRRPLKSPAVLTKPPKYRFEKPTPRGQGRRKTFAPS